MKNFRSNMIQIVVIILMLSSFHLLLYVFGGGHQKIEELFKSIAISSIIISFVLILFLDRKINITILTIPVIFIGGVCFFISIFSRSFFYSSKLAVSISTIIMLMISIYISSIDITENITKNEIKISRNYLYLLIIPGILISYFIPTLN